MRNVLLSFTSGWQRAPCLCSTPTGGTGGPRGWAGRRDRALDEEFEGKCLQDKEICVEKASKEENTHIQRHLSMPVMLRGSTRDSQGDKRSQRDAEDAEEG